MRANLKCLVLLSALALAGCGSFPLGTVYPEKGQTVRERDADMLYCKDWSTVQNDTSGRVAASFVAGLTIIGAPIAIHESHENRRRLFAQCMNERGYRVVAPT